MFTAKVPNSEISMEKVMIYEFSSKMEEMFSFTLSLIVRVDF